MTDRIETTIAEAAQAHRPWMSWGITPDGIYCGACERRYPPDEFPGHSSAAILAALKAARMAVVELPEPLRRANWPHVRPGVWPLVIGGETEAVGAYPDDGDEPVAISGVGRLSIRESRVLAAALLAAADAAEGIR